MVPSMSLLNLHTCMYNLHEKVDNCFTSDLKRSCKGHLGQMTEIKTFFSQLLFYNWTNMVLKV